MKLEDKNKIKKHFFKKSKKVKNKAKKEISKQVEKEIKQTLKNKKKFAVVCASLILIFVIVAIGVGYYFLKIRPNNSIVSDGELSIHFLELGNNYTGDCVYIKSGNTDILIDAGSRTNSVSTITNYLDKYVSDKKLEYVIVTHAHQDHIACFAGDKTNKSLFDIYQMDIIIDFNLTNYDQNFDDMTKNKTYKNYIQKRNEKIATGTKHYTALECCKEQNGAKKQYEISPNVTMEILYQKYYEINSSNENDYSVCMMLKNGAHKYLFTGDLEEKGEQSLIENNRDKIANVTLFKAGHHGSYTATSDELLSVIKPKICVVTCVAGSVQYSKTNLSRTFPSQAFVDRISQYTDKVYVTTLGFIEENGVDDNGNKKYKDTGFASFNGNIVISSKDGIIEINCSNNNEILKNSQWFNSFRTMPNAWL